MQVYHFDMATGQYIRQSKADESPLEPGVYLIPAHATTTPPPSCDDGEQVRWDGEAWQVEPLPVEESTEEHPADQTPPTDAPSAYDIRTHRDDLIKQVRWRIERHKDQKALGLTPVESLEPLLKYTQALRDVPQQEGFPTSVVWPECPPDPTNPKPELDDSKDS